MPTYPPPARVVEPEFERPLRFGFTDVTSNAGSEDDGDGLWAKDVAEARTKRTTTAARFTRRLYGRRRAWRAVSRPVSTISGYSAERSAINRAASAVHPV